MTRPEADRRDLELRLREVEAERDELRSRVEARTTQILATADRLRTLEQLFETIQAGRAYRLLRRLGRWRWVEHTLDHLRGNTGPADRHPALVDAGPTVPPAVRGLAHNIPRLLPGNATHLAGFRVRNAGSTAVHLSAGDTLFWTAGAVREYHTIEVHLDGHRLLEARVPGDHIAPGESASFFFPLHGGPEGDHRLQVFIAPRSDIAGEHRRTLFDIAYGVDRTATRSGPMARLRNAAFMILSAELPMLANRWRCRRASLRLRLAGESAGRRMHLQRWKHENRRLAFMEQQTRKERVASRPCYLSIDTTVACNLRCPFCFRQNAAASAALRAAGEMPNAVVDEIIAALLPTAYTINMSSWGEPLLSPHLDTLLDACRRFEVFLSFTTNGTLLNKPGLLDRLVPVLHRLEISVDSGRREMFERLRGGARLEHVLANARTVGQIRSSRPDPRFSFGFSMTLYRENLQDVPDVLRIVADCGGNFLRTDIGVIFGKSDLDHSVLNCPDAYNEMFASARRRAAELGVDLFMRPPLGAVGESAAARASVCDYLYTHACVAWDGSFKPCFFVVLPGRPGAAPGRPDAAMDTLLGRWNDEQMRRLRREHDTDRAHELCKRCYMTLRGRDSASRPRDLFVRGEAAG